MRIRAPSETNARQKAVSRAKPKNKRRGVLSVKEVERQFDATIEDNAERRKAFADCMGLSLKEAIKESRMRRLANSVEKMANQLASPSAEEIGASSALVRTAASNLGHKVAHAQLSDSSARTRYKELCKSIPERGKQCLQHANSLMAQMWAMAEEVYELKGVCKTLGKPYESEAIRLCAGETAFHYLRDLHTAFAGNRRKALECAKAPYTLLREFRAERAAKNREKKCQAAENCDVESLNLSPADRQQETPGTGARPALPTGSSLARNIEMQPHVIDVVAELPVSVSAIGQPLAADDDAHPDVCPSSDVDELAQYKDATDKAEAFIKCSLFDGDVRKALDFLKAHFLEKPTDEHSVALPDGSNCADHTTAEKAAVCGVKRATAKKKTTAAKKQANPADTSWPPPIVCGEVSTWEEAKKGQYVMWGGLGRVMVIDDIQDSEIILEDPFYPKGTYPHEVARNMWDQVRRTSAGSSAGWLSRAISPPIQASPSRI
jgi:hypothetical protein